MSCFVRTNVVLMLPRCYRIKAQQQPLNLMDENPKLIKLGMGLPTRIYNFYGVGTL